MLVNASRLTCMCMYVCFFVCVYVFVHTSLEKQTTRDSLLVAHTTNNTLKITTAFDEFARFGDASLFHTYAAILSSTHLFSKHYIKPAIQLTNCAGARYVYARAFTYTCTNLRQLLSLMQGCFESRVLHSSPFNGDKRE